MNHISVIATVLNEGESIRRLMDSLVAQTCPPDEVVIVDGGSRDHTVAILNEYAGHLPLRVVVEAGCNISTGRNRAIAAAKGEIIAATDAGVVLAPDWLEQITRPLREDPMIEWVGGFFQAEAQTIFEAALGAATLPLVNEIDAETFLPSSRSVAFRKSAWQRVGGYPEWLDYCEDLIFDLRMKGTAAPFAFAPNALVYFRPRKTLKAFARQYYLYARGDGKADLWRKRHAIRYATYLLAAPLLLLLTTRVSKGFGLIFLLGGVIYLRQPYRRLRTVLNTARRENGLRVTLMSNLAAIAWIPLIRLVGDLAKMAGYPVGVWWRWMNKPVTE
jgi:glycosyltransferase involved in cell wall biosynthesis